jgi:tetratricopeptide (TPR) repeat protein
MDSPVHSSKSKSEQKTLYVTLSDFLRNNRVAVLILFAVIVLAVIGVAVGTAIKDGQTKAAAASLEKLDADYAAYSSEQDATKKAELEKSFVVSADKTVKQWNGKYAAQKALAYKAKIDESNKDWSSAEKEWLSLLSSSSGSYLAPVALQGAAAAAEEQGAFDRSLADYKKLVDKYASTTIGIPHAYFSIGRLSEGTKDYAGALAAYQKIVSTWPDSDWTKLATDRIIFLKSSGLVK